MVRIDIETALSIITLARNLCGFENFRVAPAVDECQRLAGELLIQKLMNVHDHGETIRARADGSQVRPPTV